MKDELVIKKWQLLSRKSREELADLREKDFVAVGKRVFYKSRVEEALLPSMTAAIKTEAFAECRRLHTVVLPEESGVGLSMRAFRRCVRLSRVEHSRRITSIGEECFDGCLFLSDLTLGNDLRRIGARAFRDCMSVRSLQLPAGIGSVGAECFRGCTELRELVLSDGVSALAPGMFRDCISLGSLAFPESLTEIPANAFRSCSALEELTIPSHVQSVGRAAFLDCARLRRIDLSSGVRRVGARAFAALPRLQEVQVPFSLSRLGAFAFGGGYRKKEERISLLVENDYTARRLRRLLFFCGSAFRANVCVTGRSIEERKRERRRKNLVQDPVHLVDFDQNDN